MMVLHKCDVRNCVNPVHLFLGTHLDNMQDRARKGRTITAKGGRSPLTEAQVLEIRRLYAETSITQVALGKLYAVSPSSIWCIVHNKYWKQAS